MATAKTDAQLQRDVWEELRWDTRVGEDNLRVTTNAGVIELRGAIPSQAAKRAARAAALRVAGVLAVIDHVQVRLPRSSPAADADLGQDLREALAWDVFVPGDGIRISVIGGLITLDGEVNRWSERRDVERVVERFRGVKEVNNNITVKAPGTKPQLIRKLIQQALERSALAESGTKPQLIRKLIQQALERSALAEANRIEVQVEDGTVTLAGTLRTWPEEQAVLGAVGHAPGVHSVKNKLRLNASTIAGGW